MCIAKCLYSYKDNSPENLGTTTVQEHKMSTSDWRASLKNVFAWERETSPTRHKTEPVQIIIGVIWLLHHLFQLWWFPYFLNIFLNRFLFSEGKKYIVAKSIKVIFSLFLI